jgi:hypothetical protein
MPWHRSKPETKPPPPTSNIVELTDRPKPLKNETLPRNMWKGNSGIKTFKGSPQSLQLIVSLAPLSKEITYGIDIYKESDHNENIQCHALYISSAKAWWTAAYMPLKTKDDDDKTPFPHSETTYLSHPPNQRCLSPQGAYTAVVVLHIKNKDVTFHMAHFDTTQSVFQAVRLLLPDHLHFTTIRFISFSTGNVYYIMQPVLQEGDTIKTVDTAYIEITNDPSLRSESPMSPILSPSHKNSGSNSFKLNTSSRYNFANPSNY